MKLHRDGLPFTGLHALHLPGDFSTRRRVDGGVWAAGVAALPERLPGQRAVLLDDHGARRHVRARAAARIGHRAVSRRALSFRLHQGELLRGDISLSWK